MPRYEITGQVYLASGFTWEIDAANAEDAEGLAHARAERTEWTDASIQEVCIENTVLISTEAPATEDKAAEWHRLCAEQRAAYQAWQVAPDGWSGDAFAHYINASNALARFEEGV